jgi:hypothetical protein
MGPRPMEAKRNAPEPLRATSEQPIPAGLAMDVVSHKRPSRVVFTRLKRQLPFRPHNFVNKVDNNRLLGAGWGSVATPPGTL